MAAATVKRKVSGKDDELLLVGGQAVIEGVLMRTKDNTAVAVRSNSGRIVRKRWDILPISKRIKIFK